MTSLQDSLSGYTAEQIRDALRDHPNLKVLTRLEQPALSPIPPEEPGYLVILDTEATGTDALVDEIVELGMLKVLYCRRSLRLCAIVDRFNELRDPGFPMPEAASRVNHITDELLRGKSIDFTKVAQFIEDADLVVAHNANYDRQLCERYAPEFAAIPWACSQREVPWADVGITGAKLDYIAFCLGFFYEGHRATVDCEALLQVLGAMVLTDDGPTTPFELMLRASKAETIRIYAFGAPFDKKDVLKARGYRWHPGDATVEKSWHVTIDGEDAFQEEVSWLRENVYARRGFSPGVVRIDNLHRHSCRLPTMSRQYL